MALTRQILHAYTLPAMKLLWRRLGSEGVGADDIITSDLNILKLDSLAAFVQLTASQASDTTVTFRLYPIFLMPNGTVRLGKDWDIYTDFNVVVTAGTTQKGVTLTPPAGAWASWGLDWIALPSVVSFAEVMAVAITP